MTESIMKRVERDVVIGVVREDAETAAIEIARAYARGGIRLIEITMTTPGAARVIERIAAEFPDVALAAGTVRTTDEASSAIRSGATIVVSPHTSRAVIEYGRQNDLLVVAGAATPTEIITASEMGADVVKVYPARLLGGPDYFRTIRQPIRGIAMLAGGPVEIEEIADYLAAGAIACNLGGALAVPEMVRTGNWGEIERRAASAVAAARAARGGSSR